MKDKMLIAQYGSEKTPLTINGIEIPCFVLSDGKRVVTQRGLIKALGMSVGSTKGRADDRIMQLIGQDRFSDLITSELAMMSKSPIKFKMPTGMIAFGYEATILVDICDMIIQAAKKDRLLKSQIHIGERAEILFRGFAKTGIIALVDEATGYQKVRDTDALQRFLQKFLENEKGKWVTTFPPDFFEAIFKMKGWSWKEATSSKKPQVVGHYINNYLYSRLAPSVLKELREKNPKNEAGNRKGKHTQWINPDYGHPILKERLNTLTAFARACGFNWTQWDRMVKRAFPKFGDDGSQELEFPFPDE